MRGGTTLYAIAVTTAVITLLALLFTKSLYQSGIVCHEYETEVPNCPFSKEDIKEGAVSTRIAALSTMASESVAIIAAGTRRLQEE